MSNIDYDLVRIGIYSSGLAIFLFAETVLPSRESSVSKTRRWLNNIGLAFINVAFLQLLLTPLVMQVAAHATQQQYGVLNLIQAPRWMKIVDTIVLMDLFVYLWHILLHRVPVLWRFHRVHHTDLNMDASSMARFHICELALNTGVRIGVAYFLGADPFGIFLFECLYIAADLFRHSSIILPDSVEKLVWILFVPPAMHHIHHSVSLEERNTNFGTIFSFWDRLAGTLLTGVNQKHLWFGVDGHIQEKKLDLHHLLMLPFLPAVK